MAFGFSAADDLSAGEAMRKEMQSILISNIVQQLSLMATILHGANTPAKRAITENS